jgi:general secretion pathway protein D
MNAKRIRSIKWWMAIAVVAGSAHSVYAQVPPVPVAPAPTLAAPAPALPTPIGVATVPTPPVPAPVASTPVATVPAAPGADPEPPGAKGALPTSMEAIAKATDIPYRAKPPGHLVKFNLQDADLAELVNHISGLTGRRFIYGQKVRQIKATVVSPEPVTLAEAYEAFLSILEANGMTVIPHGRFYKIVDSGGVVTQSTPIVARGEPVPVTDRYVTRLYRLQNVGADEAAALLTKFKSKEADVSVYAPGQLLIITDTGTNVDRMIRILEEIDVGGAGQSMWIEPVHYGAATDMAQRINELFGASAPGGGLGGGLTRVTADPLTNSLIVVGTEDAYLKLLEMLKRLDGKPDGTGSVRVVAVQNAKAEELANVLTQMMANVKTAKEAGQTPNTAADRDMFEGAVRIVADKATNSLVITSSARDYATVRLVIEQLDQPRRQVFIEAVIMDLDVTDSTKLGTSWHGGYRENLGSSSPSIFAGGFHSQDTLAFPPNQDMLQGFAIGVRGPDLPGTQNLLGTGVSIPAFGVALHALTTAGTSNVLATPHIIATDNVAAEIQVGKNIPLQQNVGGGLGNLASLASSATGSNSNTASLLSGLSGFGGGYSAPRQDVGIKIKVTPHINEKNQVHLELEQESSDQGATSGAIGAVTVIKRTASTSITVDDQQTVIIGGLMKEEQMKSDDKIPLLGDIPVLGFLFRHETNEKRKSNLLLVLTPYVIRDQTDLRRIFERKMQERQEFLDRYFVFTGKDWSPPRDYARANGLVEEIRQAYLAAEEQIRLLRESESSTKEHQVSAPIELPEVPTSGSGAPAAAVAPAAAPGAVAAPAPGGAPKATSTRPKRPATAKPANKAGKTNTKKAPPRRGGKPKGELTAPIVLRPAVRNVDADFER